MEKNKIVDIHSFTSKLVGDNRELLHFYHRGEEEATPSPYKGRSE